ncbi:hypothetical protein [Prauserella rugosa]|uniref:Excreted virulence factor EspC (Type VII ESX diderm) n=1 Tax=Prauserella rugosa TaxID=43354 RepID=A0A660CJZ3_9PSEU|nr:hypothetical protein [Prauserella rugosa]KMS91371.1 hypothetical protein ACZ91_10000 [Streptomyces regensis]TWH22197.1 excreted virulence factor EspC (type VII ESX diderm) [Prauserella rugosa]
MTTGGPGFALDPEHLRKYTQNLGQYKEQTQELAQNVHQADVGDKSWGIVGLFTKQEYTELLNELDSHIKSMLDGLHSAAEKINDSAEKYETNEREVARQLKAILTNIQTAQGGPQVG